MLRKLKSNYSNDLCVFIFMLNQLNYGITDSKYPKYAQILLGGCCISLI